MELEAANRDEGNQTRPREQKLDHLQVSVLHFRSCPSTFFKQNQAGENQLFLVVVLLEKFFHSSHNFLASLQQQLQAEQTWLALASNSTDHID